MLWEAHATREATGGRSGLTQPHLPVTQPGYQTRAWTGGEGPHPAVQVFPPRPEHHREDLSLWALP